MAGRMLCGGSSEKETEALFRAAGLAFELVDFVESIEEEDEIIETGTGLLIFTGDGSGVVTAGGRESLARRFLPLSGMGGVVGLPSASFE